MGSDRRQFFNQLVNLGALSSLAAMLPSDVLQELRAAYLGRRQPPGCRYRQAAPLELTPFTLTRKSYARMLGIH